MRIGFGYDVHRLVEERELILGGVNVPYEKGLLGHSDADVLIHAIIDALFGAISLGDIGTHFPPTDPKYKGASSLKLLCHAAGLLKRKRYVLGNIDSTIVCEAPKLAPFIPAMTNNIASALLCSPGRISVKATTEEGVGTTGSGMAVSAFAVALLNPENTDGTKNGEG